MWRVTEQRVVHMTIGIKIDLIRKQCCVATNLMNLNKIVKQIYHCQFLFLFPYKWTSLLRMHKFEIKMDGDRLHILNKNVPKTDSMKDPRNIIGPFEMGLTEHNMLTQMINLRGRKVNTRCIKVPCKLCSGQQKVQEHRSGALMHALKGILNLPTSILHLCSPSQQNC